jgi:hypothetical protein
MRSAILGFLSLLFLVPIFGYGADKDSSAAQASKNRMLKVEGFMRKTKVVKADVALSTKLSAAKAEMKVLRTPKKKAVGKDKGPQTIAEAAEYLRKHVSMAYPPSSCTEYDGVFYFSGGTSAEAVEDFSTGFAIKKGQEEILTWEKPKKKAEKK